MKKLFFTFSLFFLNSCVQPNAPIPISVEDTMPDSTATNEDATVLIYGGPGSWKAEISAFKKILFEHQVAYEVKSPDEINELTITDYEKYKTIIFAGGDAPTVRRSLTEQTRANLRVAVQIYGLNYLGFCAGAWLAVAPAPLNGHDVSYGLGVVNGPVQEINYLAKQGREFAIDRSSFPDGSSRNLLWYGGPTTPNIPGSVIAKYSDGMPAISQIRSGKGLVIISGLHPAATKSILSSLNIKDNQAIAPDYAWVLLEAVISNKPLPTFN